MKVVIYLLVFGLLCVAAGADPYSDPNGYFTLEVPATLVKSKTTAATWSNEELSIEFTLTMAALPEEELSNWVNRKVQFEREWGSKDIQVSDGVLDGALAKTLSCKTRDGLPLFVTYSIKRIGVVLRVEGGYSAPDASRCLTSVSRNFHWK